MSKEAFLVHFLERLVEDLFGEVIFTDVGAFWIPREYHLVAFGGVVYRQHMFEANA